MSEFKPNYETHNDYITFVETTLIPDLYASGQDETAHDFMEAIYWIRRAKSET